MGKSNVKTGRHRPVEGAVKGISARMPTTGCQGCVSVRGHVLKVVTDESV